MRPAILACAAALLVASPPAGAESYLPPAPADLDLLVVVDSAPGAAEERAALAARIGGFVEEVRAWYATYRGAALGVHVGVVTGDLGTGAGGPCPGGGDGGAMLGGPGIDGAFVRVTVDAWGGETRNFDGELAGAVAALIAVDAAGCPVQQPLRAIEAALGGDVPGTAAFRRPHAALAVIVLGTTDDCSTIGDGLFDPAAEALGPVTPLRCARAGWACTPPIDAAPGTHDGCGVALTPLLRDPDETVARLVETGGGATRVVIGVLRGPLAPVEVVGEGEAAAVAPSCAAGDGTAAAPGLRLEALAAAHAGASRVGSPCGDDLDETLAALVDPVAAAVWSSDPPPPPDGWHGDAGPDPGGDAGDHGHDGDHGGCGCASGGGGAGGLALLGLALAGISGRRGSSRRRRRRA